ncbi:hypothetical protein [Halorussus salinisoli]|uniref:hypothetical protein n=1 Tax=Halorussus salinisoli TaxID=2558242 RepID=UPI0010C1CB48|nr:hypothetical protein [Halorussus salinisoli]
MALVDVLAYDQPDGETVYRAVEAGRASDVVAAHEAEYRKRRGILWAFAGMAAVASVGYSLLIVQRPLFGVVAALGVLGVVRHRSSKKERFVPSVAAERLDRSEAVRQYDVETIPSGSRAGSHR